MTKNRQWRISWRTGSVTGAQWVTGADAGEAIAKLRQSAPWTSIRSISTNCDSGTNRGTPCQRLTTSINADGVARCPIHKAH